MRTEDVSLSPSLAGELAWWHRQHVTALHKCLCSPHYDPDCQAHLVLSPQTSSCSMLNVTGVRKNTIPKVKGTDHLNTYPQVFL